MSTRFHLNKKGEARPCSATVGSCPYGDASEHYESAVEARAAFEESMSAVPELLNLKSNASAAAFQSFEPNEAPLTAEEEEWFPADPQVEDSLPPEEYRGLNELEVDELLREEWQEERSAIEQRDWELRNKWSGY